MNTYSMIALVGIPFLAFIVDLLVGDPHSKYHPVVLIGKVISFYERIFYCKRDGKIAKLLYGFMTVVAVLMSIGFCLYLIQWGIERLPIWYYIAWSVLLLYISISPRSLAQAGFEIATYLRHKKLEKARFKVGWIVGRDTNHLDESEITRATVETIAENTVDGIIGPLLFYACFGPIGALLYRTINTMDSMLGYKNKKYLYFGKFAARLDDLVNLIPARITFLLFIFAAFIYRKDWKKAWTIGIRDARKHPSPNGGYAEAPVAGALHIRLGGYNSYGGIQSFRAYMGDPKAVLRAMHINKTITLMYITSLLGVLISMGLRYFLYGLH